MPSKRKSSSSAASKRDSKRIQITNASPENALNEEVVVSVNEASENAFTEDVVLVNEAKESPFRSSSAKKKTRHVGVENEGDECRFIGKPVNDGEARKRWAHRYQGKKKSKGVASLNGTKGQDEEEEIIQARYHFIKAKVDDVIYNLGDDAHVKAEEGKDNYICKLMEMFEAWDGSTYFTAQWFYRAKDTAIQTCSNFINDKRVFLSEMKDDNPLDCLVERLKIVKLPANVDSASRNAAISECDYYYDMMYLLPYSSFVSLPSDNMGALSESDSTISSETDAAGSVNGVEVSHFEEQKKSKMTMLDLYSGCGAMSTGLCLGANSGGVNLVTKWAVDLNQYACASLKLNHPETEVRNESAEDFLSLLKEWEELCTSFSLIGNMDSLRQYVDPISMGHDEGEDNDEGDDNGEADADDGEVFEVEEVLAICYGDPKENEKPGLHLKVRWKGYGPEEDTWEPIEGLGDCQERIKEFVSKGYKSKILPLPGSVDVICGGPPCQGISGFNRFRNKDNPLEDPKNKQLVVFMDIVDYLKPGFVLMENVVDIVRFAGGFLGRYALGRLIGMDYQARLGLMAAGAYGLPQFRMRMFMWGARSTQKLPQYPLPTHNVVVRGGVPNEFESCAVAYEEGREVDRKMKLFLGDAISDLPPVGNDEARDEMPYGGEPKTEFQQFIRLRKDEMPGCLTAGSKSSAHVLFDHRPLLLNEDDYQRVCQIPKRKGANFRDLKGVQVRDDNKVEFDPSIERVYLPSGKPLVPDYAMSFVRGSSPKPFGRLWWDETVPTVVTRAEPHNQMILHPQQDRVLTIRENARLQGFPDYYKLIGPIKERYIQVGNAVAVPVARALGYSLALASRGLSGEEPIFTLPDNFPAIVEPHSPTIEEDDST